MLRLLAPSLARLLFLLFSLLTSTHQQLLAGLLDLLDLLEQSTILWGSDATGINHGVVPSAITDSGAGDAEWSGRWPKAVAVLLDPLRRSYCGWGMV